jgi:hypothetical protein
MSNLDHWDSFGRYVDLDAAYAAEQEWFEEQLQTIWANASALERKRIVRERGARGIRDKSRRELTPTEQELWDEETARDAYYYRQADEAPGEEMRPF